MVSSEDNTTTTTVESSQQETIQKLKENNGEDVSPSTSSDDVEIIEDTNSVSKDGEKTENGEKASNGTSHSNGNGTQKGTKRKDDDDDVIELDDDSSASSAPPAKKAKEDQPSPVPDDPTTTAAPSQATDAAKTSAKEKSVEKEKGPELTNSEALLNKLESYIGDAIDQKKNTQRKVLDALLGAINVQVQREPLSVRKLILDKQLVLPNTITFPPSQVVDFVIEHDPDFPLSKVITKMFGEERPKLSDNEKKERTFLKTKFPAPHMTKLLVDIGQDLVQESTYCDIVHAKNLPETPKNLETYKQVAAQLKPVWEALKKKNEPYKLKQHTCMACGFRTESRIILNSHRSVMHNDGRKFQCGFCPEIDTNENRMTNHYLEAHDVVPSKEDPPLKFPCLICDEEFQYKGQRDQHMRAVCKRDFAKIRYIMAPKGEQDSSAINQWMWEKPPVDPTILAQQQSQREQQIKQQRQQQMAAAMAAQQRRQQQQMSSPALQAALLQQQQALAQQRLQQARALQQQQQRASTGAGASGSSGGGGGIGGLGNLGIGNQTLIAAMQQHLARAAQSASASGRGGSANSLQAAAGIYQRQLKQAAAAQQLAAKSAAAASKSNTNANLASAMQSMMNQIRSGPSTLSSSLSTSALNQQTCEICDQNVQDRDRYLTHLQLFHKQMKGKTVTDMQQGAPLACSRCKERFWTYEGLERHLVMSHGLVTSDLLQKAQKKEDGGRCKLCGKQYAFNMLQHLVADHQVKLCSAEIMYSCDVCSFKCSSYQKLEHHLNTVHPKSDAKSSTPCRSSNVTPKPSATDAEVVTLDD